MKNFTRFARMFMVICGIALFSSCDPETSGGGGTTPAGSKIIISDIERLPSNATTIKAYIVNPATDDGAELTSASIVNGSATINLPGTIDNEYLTAIRAYFSDEIIISDSEVKMAQIAFMACDSSGEWVGWIHYSVDKDKMEGAAIVVYSNSACTVKGTEIDGEYLRIVDVNLAKGYNWTQHVYIDRNTVSLTNGIPEGAKWFCEVI